MLQNIMASYVYTLSVSLDKYSEYCYMVAYDAMYRIKTDIYVQNCQKEICLAETVAVSAYKANEFGSLVAQEGQGNVLCGSWCRKSQVDT